MKAIYKKNCIIGEGPIWREADGRLYFVNPVKAKEICSVLPDGSEPLAFALEHSAAAIGFTKDGNFIISSIDGIFKFNERSGKLSLFSDIKNCNDAKVGPDGAFYVGTQSSKRLGISDKVDGKLYRIDKGGNARVLLDGLILSNGMDWSADGKKFYHTDSDTHILKEYDFDIESGEITYTGRNCSVPHIDGLTIDNGGMIYAACWGMGHIAKIDSEAMQTVGYIEVPVPIPSSCGFFGENLDMLAITTANYDDRAKENASSGYTFATSIGAIGKKPYLFG